MRRELVGLEAPKIQTYVLRVHVNCQGCRRKVKKLLGKIDGVYQVKIDPEEQLVTVSGTVNPETLIRKLASSGKRAELLLDADTKRDIIKSIVPEHSSNDEPKIPTFYGAQAEGNIEMKPWMTEFNRGILNRGTTSSMLPVWDYADITSRRETPGTFPEYAIGSSKYGTPASGFPTYGYPSFSRQAISHYNYQPVEPMSLLESYSSMFSIASPYTY